MQNEKEKKNKTKKYTKLTTIQEFVWNDELHELFTKE